MRLRTGLFIVLAATTTPLLAFALLAVFSVSNREEQTLLNAAVARNRATLAAVDAELNGTVGVLRALASLASLEQGRLEEFHRNVNVVIAAHPNWQNLVLNDVSGQQLVNARVKWGTPLLTAPVDTDSFELAVRTLKPAFGNVSHAPLLNREPGIAVRLPVAKDGKVQFVLTAVLRPSAFQQLLEDQKLPIDWVTGLVGNDGRLIARVPAVEPGKQASEDYRKHVAAEDEGWYRGRTLEGKDTYTAHSKSVLTGWTIGYAMPAEIIVGSAERAVTVMAAGLTLTLLIAAGVAVIVIRVITVPIAKLRDSAKALGDGLPVASVSTSIEELSEVSSGLTSAAAAVRERDASLRESRTALDVKAKALEVANQNKSRFLAVLSHELRGPLSPLAHGLTVLSGNPSPEMASQIHAVMKRQIANMSRLIEDLGDSARIDRGTLELRCASVDISKAIADAVEEVRPVLPMRRQTLNVLDETKGAAVVNADETRISQIVFNLLNNASRYTQEAGSIQLSIRIFDDTVEVAVSDDGVGFDATQAQTMFDMFVSHHDASRNAAGLGIGLSLSRWLAQEHGGSLEAFSAGPGLGATFVLRLPLVQSSKSSMRSSPQL